MHIYPPHSVVVVRGYVLLDHCHSYWSSNQSEVVLPLSPFHTLPCPWLDLLINIHAFVLFTTCSASYTHQKCSPRYSHLTTKSTVSSFVLNTPTSENKSCILWPAAVFVLLKEINIAFLSDLHFPFYSTHK